MKRKLLCVFLVITFLFSLTVHAEQQFSDINTTEWFYDNVQQLVKDSRSIVKGYPDGTFRPDQALTRDQFITMVVRASGHNLPNGSDYWAQNYIDKAYELGYLLPGDFLSFTEVISREEMSMMIVRVVEQLEGAHSFEDLTQVQQVVTDSGSFASKYQEAIMKTYKLGIITGYPDHTFKPQGVLNRAEASTVLMRIIDPNRRVAFDFDALFAELHGDMESHYLGGDNWLNPVTAGDFESAQEDWGLMTSDMSYGPSRNEFELGMVIFQSVDEVIGSIEYDENGAKAGQLEDFERLLLRRMSSEEANKVMSYLEQKDNKYDYLPHDETFFYLLDNNYLVRIDEVKVFQNTQYAMASALNLNIWFRDDSFISDHENNIVNNSTSEDTFIFR